MAEKYGIWLIWYTIFISGFYAILQYLKILGDILCVTWPKDHFFSELTEGLWSTGPKNGYYYNSVASMALVANTICLKNRVA